MIEPHSLDEFDEGPEKAGAQDSFPGEGEREAQAKSADEKASSSTDADSGNESKTQADPAEASEEQVEIPTHNEFAELDAVSLPGLESRQQLVAAKLYELCACDASGTVSHLARGLRGAKLRFTEGAALNELELKSYLGHGLDAVVFKAESEEVPFPLAVKISLPFVLPDQWDSLPERLERKARARHNFSLNEMTAMSRIAGGGGEMSFVSPKIVASQFLEVAPGGQREPEEAPQYVSVIAMEYVEGDTLEMYYRKMSLRSSEELSRFLNRLANVANGMQELLNEGIYWWDAHAEQVLVSSDRSDLRPIFLDFARSLQLDLAETQPERSFGRPQIVDDSNAEIGYWLNPMGKEFSEKPSPELLSRYGARNFRDMLFGLERKITPPGDERLQEFLDAVFIPKSNDPHPMELREIGALAAKLAANPPGVITLDTVLDTASEVLRGFRKRFGL